MLQLGFRQETALEKRDRSVGMVGVEMPPRGGQGHPHPLSRPRGEPEGSREKPLRAAQQGLPPQVQERCPQHTEPSLNHPPPSHATLVPPQPRTPPGSSQISPMLERPQTQFLGISSLSTLALRGLQSCGFQHCASCETPKFTFLAVSFPLNFKLFSHLPCPHLSVRASQHRRPHH